jgi:thiol-disulfide isomerase/thioredoxin
MDNFSKLFLKGMGVMLCMILYWIIVGLIPRFFSDFYAANKAVLFYVQLVLSFSIYLFLTFFIFRKSPLKSFWGILVLGAPFLVFLGLMQFAELNLPRLLDIGVLFLGVILIYIVNTNQKNRIIQIVLLGAYCLVLIPTYPIVYENLWYAVKKKNAIENTKLNEFDLRITDKNGKSNKLSDFKGKIICVDMWSSSCGNCIASMPQFESLNAEFQSNPNYRIISLYCPLNQSQTFEWFQKYIDRKFSYNIDYYYIDYENFNKLNIRKFPEFLLVNKEGDIKYRGQIVYERYVKDNIYDMLRALNEN